jgi:threonine/homoserine/homoserine lactone efflux protein
MRSKRNTLAIGILNLLLGWTIVGWVVALVWSFTHDSADAGGRKALLSLEQSLNNKRKAFAALVIIGGIVFMYFLSQSERADRAQPVSHEQPTEGSETREL